MGLEDGEGSVENLEELMQWGKRKKNVLSIRQHYNVVIRPLTITINRDD